LTQQPPATPDQPTQQDQPSEPKQPPGGETGLASEPSKGADTAAASEPSKGETGLASEPSKGAETATASEAELPDQPVAIPPPPPPPAAPKAQPKKRRVGLIVALTVLAALAAVAVGGFFLLSSLREDLPQVGDCLNDAPTADEMDVVACDGNDAAWSVIGSDGTWTRGDFDTAGQGEVCDAFPDTEQALWVTNATTVDSGTEGEVICLAPLSGGATGS